ncbi:hypothetical protein [Actinocorallia lasiicapitis]
MKNVKLALVGAVVAGSIVGVGAPAQAAPAKKPCAVGLWKVTGVAAVIKGTMEDGKKKYTAYKGMAGIKVKITKTALLYDFRGSKREYYSGYEGDTKVAGWEQLGLGKLALKAKLTGDKKGRLATVAKSATGNALGYGYSTAPVAAPWGPQWKVADHIRKGQFDTPVLSKTGTYLCSAKNPKKKKLQLRDVRRWGQLTETVKINLVPLKTS